MIDTEQESAFVDAFIVPEKRERYKSFLANRKKRNEILNRLNHTLDYIPSLAHRVTKEELRETSLENLLLERGASKTANVYIFSDTRDLDGLYLSLAEALDAVSKHLVGSVICCVPGELALYKAEDYISTASYILAKPKRAVR